MPFSPAIPPPRGPRRAAARLTWLLLPALFAAACGSGAPSGRASSPSPAPSQARPALPSAARWISYSQAAKTVTLTLIAGYDESFGGFNFDGYAKGRVIFSVPTGWVVTVICDNQFSRPVSCAVASLGDTTPAYPGASTADPLVGLPPGHSATFTFIPNVPGVFRILSLVPGDQAGGLWDVFVVTSGGTPSTETRA